MKIDELDLKYRRKFQESLKLEQSLTMLDTENEMIKLEIVQVSKNNADQEYKIKGLQLVNESNSKIISELKFNNDQQSQRLVAMDNNIQDLTEQNN